MALHASGIRNFRNPGSSDVLHMARTALRCESLPLVMRWCIVASQTGTIRHRSAVTCPLQMAQFAIRGKHRMSSGERPFGVKAFLVENGGVYNPTHRENAKCHRQPQAPLAKTVHAREVLEVNPLCQRLCRAHTRHDSVPQGNNRVDRSQKKQGIGDGDMEQKPPVQKFVHASLALQLSFFFTDVFQII